MPAQYGEDALFLEYFKDTPRGFLVDVGANDGSLNSNSEILLATGWGGLLIEPAIEPFLRLKNRYNRREDVTCLCVAAGPYQRKATLYTEPTPSPGQYSTLDPEWRDRCARQYGATFMEQKTEIIPLTVALDQWAKGRRIDFLTVDCEGTDLAVLQSLDWTRYRPRLVCVEGGKVTNPVQPDRFGVFGFLLEHGYQLHASTLGNWLFEAHS